MQTVSEWVRIRRLELALTQDHLAEKAGISKSFLSDLESGRRSISAETRNKTGLMHDLLTGEVRVKADEAEGVAASA